jgi:hypothetical protein
MTPYVANIVIGYKRSRDKETVPRQIISATISSSIYFTRRRC